MSLCVIRVSIFSILAFTTIASPRADENSAPAQKDVATCRSVDFGSTRYCIPDAYEPGITPYRPTGGDDGRGYAAFTLNVLLPDLRPSAADHEDMKGKGWGPHLHALFEYGLRLRDKRELIDNLLKWGNISRENYKFEANGCHVYRGRMTIAAELHVCDESQDIFTYDCKSEKDGTFAYCHVHEHMDEYAIVIYDYALRYDELAPQIDRRLRALIKSFAVPSSGNE